jgi:hypothetical protein
MADRILTTHAGSLPRPHDLADMIWARMDGQAVDEAALQALIDSGVGEVISKQKQAGIDIVSDGELSKTGFSTYGNDRFSGFGGRSEFQADDVANFPNLAMRLFNTPSMAHIVFSNCVGPVELTDKKAVDDDVDRLKRALGDADPGGAFMGTISPGQSRSTTPISTTDPTRPIWGRSPMRSPTSTGRSRTPASTSRSTHPTWRWPHTAARSGAAWATGTTTCRWPSRH